MSQITEPLMLDKTGRDIVEAIRALNLPSSGSSSGSSSNAPELTKEALAGIIGYATSEENGLMTTEQAKKLATLVELLEEDDGNDAIDKIYEVFDAFDKLKESDGNLFDLFAGKLDNSHNASTDAHSTLFAKKLDKTADDGVYATEDGDEIKLAVDAAATADALARRNARGGITVPTEPPSSSDAASKLYVDKMCASLADRIDAIEEGAGEDAGEGYIVNVPAGDYIYGEMGSPLYAYVNGYVIKCSRTENFEITTTGSVVFAAEGVLTEALRTALDELCADGCYVIFLGCDNRDAIGDGEITVNGTKLEYTDVTKEEICGMSSVYYLVSGYDLAPEAGLYLYGGIDESSDTSVPAAIVDGTIEFSLKIDGEEEITLDRDFLENKCTYVDGVNECYFYNIRKAFSFVADSGNNVRLDGDLMSGTERYSIDAGEEAHITTDIPE